MVSDRMPCPLMQGPDDPGQELIPYTTTNRVVLHKHSMLCPMKIGNPMCCREHLVQLNKNFKHFFLKKVNKTVNTTTLVQQVPEVPSRAIRQVLGATELVWGRKPVLSLMMIYI